MRPDAVFSAPAHLVTARTHAEQVLAALRIADLIGLRRTGGDHGKAQPHHEPRGHARVLLVPTWSRGGQDKRNEVIIRLPRIRRRHIMNAGCVVILSPPPKGSPAL